MKYFLTGIAAALLAGAAALPAQAGPTTIVGSGNGVGNSINVSNQGGFGNRTVIQDSANGAYNSIGVRNRGGFGSSTTIRDSANGAYNRIDVRNKARRPLPFYGPGSGAGYGPDCPPAYGPGYGYGR